jgi:hypothetical protein
MFIRLPITVLGIIFLMAGSKSAHAARDPNTLALNWGTEAGYDGHLKVPCRRV